VLETHDRFVLTTHRDPDGDGLGAEIALVEALRQLGKQARAFNEGPVPPQYRFLSGAEHLQRFSAARDAQWFANVEVAVIVDAARPARTGRLARVLERFTGTTLAIDHHLDRGWAQVEIIDARASATTELVHELILGLPVRMTPAMAEALYCGLVADTQGFRAPGTTPGAHRRSAALLEAGASAAQVHDALFAAWPIGHLRLRGAFLAALRTAEQQGLVWGVVDRAMLRRYRQSSSAIEGLVEEALTVAGAELAILFLEEPAGVRVSLRSRGDVVVDALARRLGGEGHAQAAGARIAGPLAPVMQRVLREARQTLRSAPKQSPDGTSAPPC
jgi:phosphoesterase RecJ-like protein